MTGLTIRRCWSGICALPLPLGLCRRLAALQGRKLHHHRVRPQDLVCRLLLEKKKTHDGIGRRGRLRVARDRAASGNPESASTAKTHHYHTAPAACTTPIGREADV